MPDSREKHYAAATASALKICCAKLDGRRACRKQQLKVCVLIDGELLANEASVRHRTTSMACYNKLYRLSHDGTRAGIVPCAVGASFAVLVAEQLFASVAVCSSHDLVGQSSTCPTPYFIMMRNRWR